jgi:hypothetical protein
MNIAYKLRPDTAPGITIAQSPEGLHNIFQDGCAAVIWNRQPLATFQTWVDALSPEQLPSVRLILRPETVRDAVKTACDSTMMPEGIERTHLIDDIAALGSIFADLMKAPFLRLRLARVNSNACQKFHIDALTARLICTYRGTGTQYGISTNGTEPQRVFTTPASAPILLRGTLWAERPKAGLLHRSPPIEGSGETRLVVVIDPVFDPEEEI